MVKRSSWAKTKHFSLATARRCLTQRSIVATSRHLRGAFLSAGIRAGIWAGISAGIAAGVLCSTAASAQTQPTAPADKAAADSPPAAAPAAPDAAATDAANPDATNPDAASADAATTDTNATPPADDSGNTAAEEDDDDDDWGADDSPEARNARLPMVMPDFSRQPLPPGADWKPPPQHSWVWKNTNALRYNAQGLFTNLLTGYRLQLWQLPGALYEQSHIAIKGNIQVTPAYVKLGGVVEFQPLAILNLTAGVDSVQGFGTFRFGIPFANAAAEHDDDTLDVIQDNDNPSRSGIQVTLSALTQAKIWNIAVRNQVQGFYMDMSIPDGDTVFYDTYADILFPNKSWVLKNDLDLLYITDFGLKFGGRYTHTRAYYEDDISKEAAVPMHRVGPAILYTFFQDPSPTLYNAPTLAFLTQWWARHRYRTGANTPAALPYLLLAFIHQGDFLPTK